MLPQNKKKVNKLPKVNFFSKNDISIKSILLPDNYFITSKALESIAIYLRSFYKTTYSKPMNI
jgi:hypothetical protein